MIYDENQLVELTEGMKPFVVDSEDECEFYYAAPYIVSKETLVKVKNFVSDKPFVDYCLEYAEKSGAEDPKFRCEVMFDDERKLLDIKVTSMNTDVKKKVPENSKYGHNSMNIHGKESVLISL